MTKQIKVGFDRSISPKVKRLDPLYDITGVQLKNENNQPLYTQEVDVLENFYASKKSLPVHVNNENAVKVVEQFPETSQVSSSLLGVPRDEKQLGLFSDVSVYGFDNNIWEFFTIGYYKNPYEWLTRKNKTYGNRFSIRAEEISSEQAIALKAYPVSWSFPYGPKFDDQGLYNEELYPAYVKFFQLGIELYDAYMTKYTLTEDERYEVFAKNNFLLPDMGYIQDQEVFYNNDKKPEEIFEDIEKWTITWIKLRNGILFDPDNEKIVFPDGYDQNNTRPGYSSDSNFYGQIESRKAFRYQPGRISGFTFGLRCSSDQASLDNIIEWGCANDTDEYMFQVKGPEFNIIRRSTVPLPEQNLIDMGLSAEDQQLLPPLNTYKNLGIDPDTGAEIPARSLYTTVIKQDFFNNDKLNGNGPSGYILNIEQVTMYKIEFSWYGAIGAKFYAYVPAGNGEARWVLIHTLVIENKIGEPCLNDPYFKFRYVMNLNETSRLVAPQYVYKYGASYYIDGGDEGATTSYSAGSEEVSASPLYTKSVMGLTAKNFIKNSVGTNIRNKKDVIPESMSITTDNPVRIDIMECEGCPGFAHHYTASLHNGISGTSNSFIISQTGNFITYSDPDGVFTQADVGKKLIGDGIYSTYIASVSENGSQAFLKRKLNPTGLMPEPSPLQTYNNTIGVILENGNIVPAKGGTFNMRLTGYDSIAAASIGLTKPNIDVNFLNPYSTDGRSFADFFIGITDKSPSISTEGELLFAKGNDPRLPFNINDVLYGEWTNYRLEQDINGNEYTESDERYAYALQIDPQIPTPPGSYSGGCSRLSARVSEFNLECEFTTTLPAVALSNEEIAAGNYLIFPGTEAILEGLEGLKGGELGIPSGGSFIASGVKFVSDKATVYYEQNVKKFIVAVDGSLTGVTQIAFKSIRIFGRYINKTKVFSFDIYPLHIVIGMRDNAKVNNISIEEYDNINKFSYAPQWLLPTVSPIELQNAGSGSDVLDRNNGLFLSGGFTVPGDPATNYLEVDRLSSALVDTQLQQPLRPGKVKTTVFLGENESRKVELDYLFGQDRYLITPGSYNTKATFVTVKALDQQALTQVTLNFKEQ